jgi:hypothetical protein
MQPMLLEVSLVVFQYLWVRKHSCGKIICIVSITKNAEFVTYLKYIALCCASSSSKPDKLIRKIGCIGS